MFFHALRYYSATDMQFIPKRQLCTLFKIYRQSDGSYEGYPPPSTSHYTVQVVICVVYAAWWHVRQFCVLDGRIVNASIENFSGNFLSNLTRPCRCRMFYFDPDSPLQESKWISRWIEDVATDRIRPPWINEQKENLLIYGFTLGDLFRALDQWVVSKYVSKINDFLNCRTLRMEAAKCCVRYYDSEALHTANVPKEIEDYLRIVHVLWSCRTDRTTKAQLIEVLKYWQYSEETVGTFPRRKLYHLLWKTIQRNIKRL
jgi:hypothetical protein